MHTSAGETESETESRAKPEPGRDIRAHPVQVIVLCENNCCLCVYVCLSDAGIFGFRFCTRDLYTWAFNKFSANFSPACAFIKTGSVRVPPAEGIPGFQDLAFSILVLRLGIPIEMFLSLWVCQKAAFSFRNITFLTRRKADYPLAGFQSH